MKKLLLVFGVFTSCLLFGQEKVDEATTARIRSEEMEHSQIMRIEHVLTDRYGPLPEPAQRLVAVARLRLLCRQYGVTEVAATGTGSVTTLRVSPLTLPDSGQLRLKRVYPGAAYRATT